MLALVLAITWPSTYRSTAVVLIEEPELPASLIETGFSDYIDQRLQELSRRVLVPANIRMLIKGHGLYDVRMNDDISDTLVQNMRNSVGLKLVSAEGVHPRTGVRQQSTFAFELSFEYKNKLTAQKVTAQLLSMYIETSKNIRRARTTQRLRFIAKEREHAESQLKEISRDITQFKSKYRASLPDQAALNQEIFIRTEDELRELDLREDGLREEETVLRAELEQLRAIPVWARSPDIAAATSARAQLERATLELASLRGTYAPNHPDIVRLRERINSLEALAAAERPSNQSTNLLDAELDGLTVELRNLQERYGPTHPDIQRVTRAKAQIEAALDGQTSAGDVAGESDPALLTAQARLEAVRSKIASIERRRGETISRRNDYAERLATSVEIEAEYARLTSLLDDAKLQRASLVEREQAARLQLAAEEDSGAERFIVLQSANLPEHDIRPNRKAILMAGVLLAMSVGSGSLMLRHVSDDTILDPYDIAHTGNQEPLGVIPIITTEHSVTMVALRLCVFALIFLFLVAAGWYLYRSAIMDSSLNADEISSLTTNNRSHAILSQPQQASGVPCKRVEV